MTHTYPFSAFVGQEMMLTGLLLNAINPLIGGMLIRGEKGTGKSTVVRALGLLLPEIDVAADCPFSCDPHSTDKLCPACREKSLAGPIPIQQRRTKVVELPINATEDRVAGALDMEHALKTGQKRFEPGLLAAANRGILYVDEVNLLDDHIVDILLDSAAMGVNVMEREGVSFTHPARFILVGTMNPEEGDLRPQLLDRFGLCVSVKGIEDLAHRDELLRRFEAFEADPVRFRARWEKDEMALKKRIANARKLLPKVKCGDDIVRAITDLCVRMGVDGHRADLVILKTSKTHAAFCGRRMVNMDDVAKAAKFALYHRMRRLPFDEIPADMNMVDSLLAGNDSMCRNKKKLLTPDPTAETAERKYKQNPPDKSPPTGEVKLKPGSYDNQGEVYDPTQSGDPGASEKKARIRTDPRREKGRLQASRTNCKRGRYVRATTWQDSSDIALDATLRAAAPFIHGRAPGPNCVPILPEDYRSKIRTHKTGRLFVFVVDASGSMGTKLMSQAKAAILRLLDRAYKDRSAAALVAFKARGAEVLLPPTKSVVLAERKLKELPTGGATPLASGMALGRRVAQKSLRGAGALWPSLVLVTDGKANVGMNRRGALPGAPALAFHEEVFSLARSIKKDRRINSLVLDTEEKHPGVMDMAREIADHMGARYVCLEHLRPESIINALPQ